MSLVNSDYFAIVANLLQDSDRFLFLGASSLLWAEVPTKEKLQKQEQIAPVHDEGGTVVFLLDPTGRVRLVVVKAG